jgi:hypothetical protein
MVPLVVYKVNTRECSVANTHVLGNLEERSHGVVHVRRSM